MSDANKSPLDHVTATITQLKEMHHYAHNNVERLTAQWLMFEGELKKLDQADNIEGLMVKLGEIYEALEKEIEALEEVAAELKPTPEGEAPTAH